jgi:hypothetical protein
MSITLGYTRQSDNEQIVIGSYENIEAAQVAKQEQTITDVSEYWLTSFIDTETNKPSIFAYIDV